VEFIRRFQRDYNAEGPLPRQKYQLAPPYHRRGKSVDRREHGPEKTARPIRIDRHREMLPPAANSTMDDLSRGKVQVSEWRELSSRQAVVAESGA